MKSVQTKSKEMRFLREWASLFLFGYKIRFKSLYAQPAFDVTTIDYEYDDISRLLKACYDYDPITEICAQEYVYGYDLSGNLVNNDGTTRTYNEANQMTNDGTNTLTYDSNGNLTNDGVNALTWDRANRMLTAPSSTSYKYDGLSNRVQQTVSSVVTDYLNDIQPGLTKLLRQADGTNTDHFIHAPRGIHAVDDGTDWKYAVQDGLRSVRGWADGNADVNNPVSYSPYGVPDTSVDGFAYTGEMRDRSDLQYHRARYYSPNMATWTRQDFAATPNRYAYVNGNPSNMIDPSGFIGCPAIPTNWWESLLCIAASTPHGAEFRLLFGLSWVFGILSLGGSVPDPSLYPPDIHDLSNSINDMEFGNVEDFEEYLAATLATASTMTLAMQAEGVGERERVRNCLSSCPTSEPAESTFPFAGDPGSTSSSAPHGGNRSKEYDILCNLQCYNGMLEAGIYGAFLRPKRMDLYLPIARSSRLTASGEVLPYNQELLAHFTQHQNTAYYRDLRTRYNGERVNRSGGAIITFNAEHNIGRTRAEAMATLVEEIWHGTHYHTLCGTITRGQSEFLAQTGQLAWISINIATGAIAPSAFANILAFSRGLRGSLEFYQNLIQGQGGSLSDLAFQSGDCPSASGVFVPQFDCLDNLVIRHL